MSAFISVIIPTFQRNDLLSLCLEKLAPGVQTLPSDMFEVIVTDDGIKSVSRELIMSEYPWAKWVKGPGKGPAANRNNGAKSALSNWLVFTDDDCLPEPDWLSQYYSAIHSNINTEAFEGAILPTDELELNSNDLVACPVNTTGGNFWSANIMVSKKLFYSVNGFDEDYFLAAQEDQQFKIDVEKRTPILFLKDCKVFHPVKRLSFNGELAGIPKKAKNYAVYLLKNRCLIKDGVLPLYIKEFVFHLRRFIDQFGSLKFQTGIISLMWLFYGVHLVFYYAFTLKIKAK